MLLTAGDDGRAVYWAPDGTMLHDMPLSGPTFDLQFHPRQPGLISSSSYDAGAVLVAEMRVNESH